MEPSFNGVKRIFRMEREKHDEEIRESHYGYAAEECNKKNAADTPSYSADPPVWKEGAQTVHKEGKLG